MALVTGADSPLPACGERAAEGGKPAQQARVRGRRRRRRGGCGGAPLSAPPPHPRFATLRSFERPAIGLTRCGETPPSSLASIESLSAQGLKTECCVAGAVREAHLIPF